MILTRSWTTSTHAGVMQSRLMRILTLTAGIARALKLVRISGPNTICMRGSLPRIRNLNFYDGSRRQPDSRAHGANTALHLADARVSAFQERGPKRALPCPRHAGLAARALVRHVV
jgi:hypothetical protein